VPENTAERFKAMLAGPYVAFSLSPNEQKVALQYGANFDSDIYIMDLARGGLLTRFTFEPTADLYPMWSQPDGSAVTFRRISSRTTKSRELLQKPVAGSATERQLTEIDANPSDWSHDGRHLLYSALINAIFQ
jgi:Tol biopolymer transport system component